MDVLQIPGYVEAVLKERIVRDAAFLPVNETIGPFQVVPMTIRHWIVLRMTGNPLLHEGIPIPIDLQNFLWLLSPKYDFTNPTRGKKAHEKQCAKLFFFPKYLALWNTKGARSRYRMTCEARLVNAAKLIDAAKSYVAETMQDRPPVPKSQGYEPDYYSDPAYFCASFGREFGWSQEETLNTPLKRLFQYLNAMKQYNGSKTPLCNPSDSVKARWMVSLRNQKKEQQ